MSIVGGGGGGEEMDRRLIFFIILFFMWVHNRLWGCSHNCYWEVKTIHITTSEKDCKNTKFLANTFIDVATILRQDSTENMSILNVSQNVKYLHVVTKKWRTLTGRSEKELSLPMSWAELLLVMSDADMAPSFMLSMELVAPDAASASAFNLSYSLIRWKEITRGKKCPICVTI